MALLYDFFFGNSECIVKEEKLIVCLENFLLVDGLIFLELLVSFLKRRVNVTILNWNNFG